MITEFENSIKRCISVPNLHKNKQEKEDFDENIEKKKNDEQEEYILGNYKLGKILGEGTFGKVRLGEHKMTGEKVNNIFNRYIII